MNDPSDTAADSQELTPEALAVLKRARRSFGISVGILLLGFMAIAFALVYRALRDDGTAPAGVIAASEFALPANAEVISGQVSDGAVVITFRTGDEVRLRVFDPATGEVTHQASIVAGE
jgi:hypothetical protein